MMDLVMFLLMIYYMHTQVLNTSYNVTGVTTFSYGAFKLLPRSAADVSEFVSVKEQTNYGFTFILTL